MAKRIKPTVFERGQMVYFVSPLAPISPTPQDIEEFAFADMVKRQREAAPNPHIAWFAGHYVEADNPNLNGAMWTSEEIALKSVTPRLTPVTVMHDPRTAVGVIADVSLKTPEADGVPRAKLDTALALWAHRFPEAVEEAENNYAAGTLMQSMEAFASDYACSVCGSDFHKLPDGAEREQWCDCLKEANPGGGYTAGVGKKQTAVRILRNVVFTGTGLIYGTRGAKGADTSAYLESFQEEVASFHQEQRERSGHKSGHKPKRRINKLMDPIEISRQEYEQLLQAKAERDGAVKRADEAEEALGTVRSENTDLKGQVEAADAAKKLAEEKVEGLEAKVTQAEEKANQETLAGERFEKLGDGFKAKLGEKTKTNLQEDAKKLNDEQWQSRLDELAEAYGVKADAEGDKNDKNDKNDTVFSREEVARSGASPGDRDTTPSREAQGSVVGGLFKQAVKK